LHKPLFLFYTSATHRMRHSFPTRRSSDLSHYQDKLLELIESGKLKIKPEARRNEIVATVKEGLNDIPISRISSDEWGIRIPGNEEHLVYVWIDALLNYLTAVNTDSLRQF